jgi:hypothetical protein
MYNILKLHDQTYPYCIRKKNSLTKKGLVSQSIKAHLITKPSHSFQLQYRAWRFRVHAPLS